MVCAILKFPKPMLSDYNRCMVCTMCMVCTSCKPNGLRTMSAIWGTLRHVHD
jgi:hypothetical protein